MNVCLTWFLLFTALTGFAQSGNKEKRIQHYIFFSREREGIHDPAFYSNKGITGAQITYPWKMLEPEKDRYEFGAIEEDLKFLSSRAKTLFIQIQDVTFDSNYFAVPDYIREDSEFHGGVNSQYESRPDGGFYKAGWVARRWDPAVAGRFHQLLARLADQFDGRIAGINLPETAVDFPESKEFLPQGFSQFVYLDAIKSNMLTLKEAFRKSKKLLYANFMPGDSKARLDSVYQYAWKIGVGVGGPDILVYRRGQMRNSYPLIRESDGKVTTGMAVQEGNYGIINPQTGKQVTVPEILDFAKDYLRLDIIFWFNEEPYYSKNILPMLQEVPH